MTRADSPDEGLDESEALKPSETTDEAALAMDPLEEGVEPAERWSAADRYGTTPREESDDRPLESRLREERPDVPLEEAPSRPIAATPLEELDESVDDEVVPAEPAAGQGRVVAGEEVENTGEQAVRTEARLVEAPGEPAADETVTAHDQDISVGGDIDTGGQRDR